MKGDGKGATPQLDGRQVDESPSITIDRALCLKLLVGLAAVLALAYLCGAAFRAPLVTAGTLAMEQFGLTGLFLGVLATDASPLPLTNEPLIVLWITGGVATVTVFLVVSMASVTAGIVGYIGGFLVGSRTPLGTWLKHRFPAMEAFMARYGALGVALCAFLPIPFALSTWIAGMTRVGLARVALASLVRIPKTAFYVWLIIMGWNWGADLSLALQT
jgi:membrane protein YqaA with SNARE-associated domain